MARLIFPEWTETLKKWIGLLALGAPVYLVLLIMYGVKPQAIRIGYQPEQPVPYSHALHAGELGMDCRYCHNTVDRGAKAAVPPSATCMNCHQSVLPNSEKLVPVRRAYSQGESLNWARVTDLPDYVYFNHSAHVNAGVGCESCHGRVDQMVKVFQATSLTMEWCLACHRNPGPNLRDPKNVTKMGYKPTPGEARKDVRPPLNCSTCHR
jgi:menaquinone reductase, multiheme cytochrome c subunit